MTLFILPFDRIGHALRRCFPIGKSNGSVLFRNPLTIIPSDDPIIHIYCNTPNNPNQSCILQFDNFGQTLKMVSMNQGSVPDQHYAHLPSWLVFPPPLPTVQFTCSDDTDLF